jgi:hypothetical protein
VDVSALQTEAALRAAAADLEKKTGGCSMSQCPYRIKENRPEFVLWHCKLEDGHEGEHTPWLPVMGRGDRSMPVFEGIWHKPGEKSTADPEPYVPCIPSCWPSTRPEKVLKEATSNQTEVRSTK